MNDFEIRRLLKHAKTIATVGMSSNTGKAAGYVPEYLITRGYHVIPVNPTAPEIQGLKAYPDLLAVPEPVDIVQIFRPSEDVPPIVDQAIQIGAKAVWMQVGIAHQQAADKARAAGLQVVMERCMMVEHTRLIGS